ncbi:hypothetical protein CTM63_05185 [Prevotella intermedia]|nr:hypothetical protein CTM63_05185 [Prevotella intermedia]
MFCVPKAAVLHGKSVGFASQKSHFRNVKTQLSLFNRIIFTKLNEKTHTTSLGLTKKHLQVCWLNLLSYTELISLLCLFSLFQKEIINADKSSLANSN